MGTGTCTLPPVGRRRVRWLSDEEERAWRAYRRMRTLLDLHVGRDLYEDSGLSEADYDVLSTLTEGEGHVWRARDLASRLLWSTSRLAHQLRRMEQRNLVRREPYTEDRRGALISLTDQGWATLREAAPDHVRSVRRHLIDLLGPQDIEALDRIATIVIDHLTPPTSADGSLVPTPTVTRPSAP